MNIQRFESVTVVAAVCIAIVMTTAAPAQDRGPSKPGEEKAKTSQPAGKKSDKAIAPNVPVNTVESLERAIRDLIETFGEKYAKGQEYLAKLDALKAKGAQPGDVELEKLSTEALLANPLLGFEKLLVVKIEAKDARKGDFGANFGSGSTLGNQIAIISPARPDDVEKVLHKGSVNSVDLHWDGRRILFSSGNKIAEINVDGTGLRTISAKTDNVGQFDACYLPDGKIMFVSTACEQAVPCTGGGGVGNMHVMEADGSNERRLTFDQDHNWHPAVMNDGRVLYLRWEYTDLPHYFSRILFRMNPDGTGQMEYYGSGSYWPNSMFWARPIPGHPTMVACIVTGHHNNGQNGELLLLDPARGRQEADGVVQRIPGFGRKVEPIIKDVLVEHSWPKFVCPWPLAEPKTHLGAGKYFLAGVKKDAQATWDLCLVDIFDNITPILVGGCTFGMPVFERPTPPVVPSTVKPGQKDATVYLADVYQGDGLRGYPRGSIKSLRIGSHHYRFAGNGLTRASSYEGGWDVKKILGTVPVNDDGSAFFRVPANTPIFVQPLDAEGKSQQLMRSWYTAMPGEAASCIGCHERQNSAPLSKHTAAAYARPAEIAPWNGPTRGFSFEREVQPVLDRRCVGCHDGKPYALDGKEVATADLRAKRLRTDVPQTEALPYRDKEGPAVAPLPGAYSPAYVVLQQYVRRVGYESDMHMFPPAEFDADTSALVQMLKKGHYNVQLTRDEWERLYTWIDFNVPYPANWRESRRPPKDEQVERRAKYKKLFANIDDTDESPLPLPEIARFEPPAPEPARPPKPLALDGWPLSAEQARKLQAAAGQAAGASADTIQVANGPVGARGPTFPVPGKRIELPGGSKMELVLVPAGRFVMGDIGGAADERTQTAVTIARPFYLGRFEVTNAQYAEFDPRHDSGYIEGRGKDRTSRGTPINAPDQPVVRISWTEAMAFCRWLSRETGLRATLPTEAQWEWACRAGTATRFNFGDALSEGPASCNLADESIQGWNYGRAERGYKDGAAYTAPVGKYPPNAWGLHEMHGNAAEWCLSSYRPYPCNPTDGRDDATTGEWKVVRGGSWNDTARYATSASRWRYHPYQPVYNVGFRIAVEIDGTLLTADRAK